MLDTPRSALVSLMCAAAFCTLASSAEAEVFASLGGGFDGRYSGSMDLRFGASLAGREGHIVDGPYIRLDGGVAGIFLTGHPGPLNHRGDRVNDYVPFQFPFGLSVYAAFWNRVGVSIRAAAGPGFTEEPGGPSYCDGSGVSCSTVGEKHFSLNVEAGGAISLWPTASWWGFTFATDYRLLFIPSLPDFPETTHDVIFRFFFDVRVGGHRGFERASTEANRQ